MKIRKNLSLHEGALDKAIELMTLLDHNDLSGLVERLIVEEYERRNGPLSLHDLHNEATPYKTELHAGSFSKQKKKVAG
jgi:hypothetical protein